MPNSDNKGKNEKSQEQRVIFVLGKFQIRNLIHYEGRLKNRIVQFRRWINGHYWPDFARGIKTNSVHGACWRLQCLPF